MVLTRLRGTGKYPWSPESNAFESPVKIWMDLQLNDDGKEFGEIW